MIDASELRDLPVECSHLAQLATDRDHTVRLGKGLIGRKQTECAYDPKAERMILSDGTLPRDRGHDRDLQPLS